jgi:D-amino-acid dehydrogenase
MKEISNSDGPKFDVLVIGGGIVGLASALELADRGRTVAVVDQGPIDGGCAVGSAGHLVPSHVIPLAAPGALGTALDGLRRADGALSVRWSAAPGFWRWMLRFARSCTKRAVDSAAPALRDLAALSDEMWTDWLAGTGQPALADGLLDVYADAKAFAGARAHAEALRRWGVAVDELDGQAARAMEPALKGPVAGAIHLTGDRSIHPGLAMAGLVGRVRSAGVGLHPSSEVVDVVMADDRIRTVRTSHGDMGAEHVVLAAGAWSGRVARLLGERIQMLPGRGLSITVDRPDVGPRRPLLLGEDHVAVGPLGDELRLSAWFQLNNFDTHVTLERLTRLEAIARRRLVLDDALCVRRRWAGLRPVTPDGVPIIGPAGRCTNVTIAAGHAMTGLTLGPGTGRIVARLVCGEAPGIDIERFSPRRFR